MPSEIKQKKAKPAVEPSARVLRSRKATPEIEPFSKAQSKNKVPEKETKNRKRQNGVQNRDDSEPTTKKAKGAKVLKDKTEQLIDGTDDESKNDTEPKNKTATGKQRANSKKTKPVEPESASRESEEVSSTVETNSEEGTPEKATNEVETGEKDNEEATSIYDFNATTINGEEVSLDKYKGHVCIIVNVASKCGHTASNYKELVELDNKYGAEKGLKILAFPCNQFGKQEPGDNQKICEFAEKKNVKFDMFAKVNVNGKEAHPLWKYLTSQKSGPKGSKIDWNFTKFLINKEGQVVQRFKSAIKPLSLVEELEKLWLK